MKLKNLNDVSPALHAIFGKNCNVRNGKVSVTTMSDVTPEQFTLLAQVSLALGVSSGIQRVGTGVKIAFPIAE